MRIRTRNAILSIKHWDGGVSSAWLFGCAPGPSHTLPGQFSGTFGAYDIPTAYVNERMEDELGRNKPNRCLHRKQLVFVDDADAVVELPTVGTPGYARHDGIDPYWTAIKNVLLHENSNTVWDLTTSGLPPRWIASGSSINEDSLKNNVIDKAYEQKADVLLNVVESPKTIQMLATVARLINNIRRYDFRGEQYRFRARLHAVRRVGKKAIVGTPGAFLAYSFGVKPIVSDISSVQTYFHDLDEELQRFEGSGNKRYSALKVLPLAFDSSKIVRSMYNGYDISETNYTGRLIQQPTVRYVLVVKPKHRYLTPVFRTLDTLMKRFTTSPAQLAWELVPFSFVLDWLYDVRGALRAIDTAMGQFPFDIVSFTRSYSYHSETTLSHIYRSSCDGSVLNNYRVGTIECKHYERIPVSIQASPVVLRSRFGQKQMLLSVALLAQFLRSAKR